jgi:imidazolonepropionase-like amidohydrolase
MEFRMADTAFVGATLIDGTGAPPVPDAAVVVRDGLIAWVGPARALDPEREVRRIDVAGKYVIPGLMDANVHLVLHSDPEILLRYEPGCYDDLVVEAAQVALRAGVTTVFDTWGPLEALRRVRDRIDAGEVVGSRIFFAGNIIGNDGPWSDDFSPGGYRGAFNPAVVDAINRHWEQGVGGDLAWMSADDVRHAVCDYIASRGIDFVKYASSAHSGFKFIVFSPDAQRAIVEEAHAVGLTAQACTLTPEALKIAMQAGVDLLQHGDSTGRHPMPKQTLELIVERQLPCVAFLKTERHVAALDANTEMPEHWRAAWVVKDRNGRELIKAGARLLLAADAGIFGPTVETSPRLGALFRDLPDVPLHLGAAHLLWLQAAIERELAPMDALLAATRNIAEAYGKADDLGTVEPGKRADLLVLNDDPLVDVQNYAHIVHVVKDGAVVDRSRLPERPILTSDR